MKLLRYLLLALALPALSCNATTASAEKTMAAAVVSCAKVDLANDGVKAAAFSCVADAAAGQAAMCLGPLAPAVISWGQDELTCLVAAAAAPK